jgi:hypothetical protein
MAWIGALSHIALDVLSGARIQIGWPLVPGRASLPLVAMADPWLLAILAAGAAMTLVHARPVRVAWISLALAAAFLSGKGAMASTVDIGEAADRRVFEARWASLTEWYVFDRSGGALTQWHVGRGLRPTRLLVWPTIPESPLVRASRSLAAVDNFLRVHDLGFAVEEPGADGETQVLWSDLRFCRRVDQTADAAAPAPIVSAATAAGLTRMACGLWFGGVFDRGGRPINQVVKVGGWVQTRPPGS